MLIKGLIPWEWSQPFLISPSLLQTEVGPFIFSS